MTKVLAAFSLIFMASLCLAETPETESYQEGYKHGYFTELPKSREAALKRCRVPVEDSIPYKVPAAKISPNDQYKTGFEAGRQRGFIVGKNVGTRKCDQEASRFRRAWIKVIDFLDGSSNPDLRLAPMVTTRDSNPRSEESLPSPERSSASKASAAHE